MQFIKTDWNLLTQVSSNFMISNYIKREGEMGLNGEN